jgi:hypothetical protein
MPQMKNQVILIIAALLFAASIDLIAQDDSTQYINGIPITADDSVANAIPEDQFPKKNYQFVTPAKLPKKLLAALTEKNQFKGWEKKGVYLDRNTGLYIITIPIKNGRRIFGLDENGKAVTYDEVSGVKDD